MSRTKCKTFIDPRQNTTKLIAIVGPMYAGKTTKLYKKMNKLALNNKKVLLVLPIVTNLYRKPKNSRNGDEWLGEYLNSINLSSIISKCKKYDVVALDEVQFFNCSKSEIEDFAMQLLKSGTTILISGLNFNFKTEEFPTTKIFSNIATSVKLLKATCDDCKIKNCAVYSYLIGSKPKKGVVKIDNGTNYIPICEACYKNRTTY